MRMVYFMITIGLIFLFSMKIVISARIATVGDHMRRLEIEKTQYEKDIQILKSEIAQISSLNNISSKAREELGMTEVVGNIVYLDSSSQHIASTQ